MSNDPQYFACGNPNATSLRDELNTRNPTLLVLLTGSTISIVVLILAVGFLLQILVIHNFRIESTSLVTSAPLSPTIAVAHACTTIIGMTVPFVMGIEAHRLSRAWLAASRVEGENRPTPFQCVCSN
jgi:hypothetical protein